MWHSHGCYYGVIIFPLAITVQTHSMNCRDKTYLLFVLVVTTRNSAEMIHIGPRAVMPAKSHMSTSAHACMRAWIHACICTACMRMHTCVDMHTVHEYICTRTYAFMHVCIQIHMHVSMYACAPMQTCIHASCICTFMQKFIHAFMHSYVHAFMHMFGICAFMQKCIHANIH